MTNFHNLRRIVDSLEVDESTKDDPIKRTFVVDGDLVFIPKGTLHGPELEPGQNFSSLSVFAPLFDRSKDNITWARDAD